MIDNNNKILHGYIVFVENNDWHLNIPWYERYYVIAETKSKAKYKVYKIIWKNNEFNFIYWLWQDFKEAICLDKYFERQNQMTIDEI